MKPSCEQLIEEDQAYEIVAETTVGKWRWGTVEELVVKHVESGKLYAATYRRSSDGETNGLRENEADICEVKPVEKIVIEYETVMPSDG